MSALDVCQWLQDTTVGTAIRESIWVFPVINGIHVLGLALSVGTIVWFDLRLLGVNLRHQPISKVFAGLMPWSFVGFAVMFASGGLLFWAEAVRAWSSVFFKIKLIFMLLAGLNALLYQLTLYPRMAEWDKLPIPPVQARLAGLLSIIFWAIVIAAGRTMAYTF
jgi:hypothetical protein